MGGGERRRLPFSVDGAIAAARRPARLNQAAGVDARRAITARLSCSTCHRVVKLAASGKRPHPLPGTGMTESSLSSMGQAQVVQICLPEQASAKEPEHAPISGYTCACPTQSNYVS
jgi:hypothetical protein